MALDPLMAAIPVISILVLMVGFRWGAARAGPAGWLIAVALAITRFGAGMRLIAAAQVKALLLTIDVLLIIWAAFLLYRVADEAGAIQVISQYLPRVIRDRGMQALLIGWPFASFLQGVGGFGVPTAVTAPLLIGLGFDPLMAVVIPSVGHAWSVSFGSLGSSFQALMGATGIAGEQLALPAAGLLGTAAVGCGVAAAHAADGWGAVRRLIGAILVLGLTMGLAQLVLASKGLWNLAGFGGGLAGLILGILIARRPLAVADERASERLPRALILAISGYVALILITVVVQLIPPIKQFLGQVVIRLDFPALVTDRGFTTPAEPGRQIPLFSHAGALLTYATMVAYLLYRQAGYYRPGALRRILVGTAERVLPSSLGIAALVAMAVVMSHAGMTESIAQGLAEAAGRSFPVMAPWIGALGAFITGSNTNSNVIFAQLQLRTAELLNFSVPLILAAQTAGGAIGSVFAPSKIVVGASTAGMAGREGEILRKLLGYCAILIVGISLLVWLMIG
jgi:lactate permease